MTGMTSSLRDVDDAMIMARSAVIDAKRGHAPKARSS
jgi:hypothetical protein